MMRRREFGLILGGLLGTPLMARGEQPVVVFAAASLTDALGAIAADWVKAGHAAPKLVFGGSSVLARQIEAGAPAQVFISADEVWMDYLDTRGLLVPGTSADVAGNKLVLIGGAAAPAGPVVLDKNLDLRGLLGGDGRLAVADPAVPAGRYGAQALKSLGLWDQVAKRLAPAGDVRAALKLVELGECKLGIVYATDALSSAKVHVMGVFDEASHQPIRYAAALIPDGDAGAARGFLNFVRGGQGRARLKRFGFSIP